MVDNKKNDELKLLYKCIIRKDSNLNEVVIYLCENISQKGKNIIND